MQREYVATWIRTSAIAGLLSNVIFGLLIAPVGLPRPMVALLAGSWGISIAISGLGVERLLRLDRPRVTAHLGALSLFAGGTILATMLILQQTLVGYHAGYRADASDPTERLILDWVARGTAPVHLGLDIVWDFFLAMSMVCFGLAMRAHPRFGPVWGYTGVIGGIALLAVNLYPFPYTPGDVGIPYVYPFVIAAWFVAVYVRCLASIPWVMERGRDQARSTPRSNPTSDALPERGPSGGRRR